MATKFEAFGSSHFSYGARLGNRMLKKVTLRSIQFAYGSELILISLGMGSGLILKKPVMEKLQQLFYRIIHVYPDYKSFIPRLVVGLVFLSEGIQKYIMPEVVGAGRFERIGFESYQFLAYFVATFEILCGVLLLLGIVTRLASIPLLVIMATALVSTKIPILLEDGFWVMAHASRTDFAMTMLLIYLIIYGAGKLSLDSFITNKLNGQK